VHHVLVGHLEKRWEPIFIHDSYACRKGKGVHVGVVRLQSFLRQATANGTREAFYLQLDIRNYFMRIDMQRLFAVLDAKLNPAKPDDGAARWLCHKLVFHDCTVNPVMKGAPLLADQLPPHKTLFHGPPGKGLPIGNLNSRFFANVYPNARNPFVKHELKCRWGNRKFKRHVFGSTGTDSPAQSDLLRAVLRSGGGAAAARCAIGHATAPPKLPSRSAQCGRARPGGHEKVPFDCPITSFATQIK